MKVRIVGAILAAALLTGCGSKTVWVSPLAQAAGIEADAVLLQVDDREIPAWQYLYWLATDCALLEERCAEADTAPDWEVARDAALEDTVLCATVETWAVAYDCALTEAKRETLDFEVHPWLSENQSRSLAALSDAYGRLYALCRTPGSPLAPVEGELELFQQERGPMTAEQILIPYNGDREAAGQEAARLFARINTAADPGEVFSTLLEETGGGRMETAAWEETTRSAAGALEPGQISGILETQSGFSILRRLPDDPDLLWEAYFEDLLSAAAERSAVWGSPALDALDAAAFWTALRKTERSEHR